MYTQCPDCKTFFRLNAANLSAANGEVCCGACDTEFNALQSLFDDLPISATGITDTQHAGELPGESGDDVAYDDDHGASIEDRLDEEDDRATFTDDALDEDEQNDVPADIDELGDDTLDPHQLKALLDGMPDDASVQHDDDDPDEDEQGLHADDDELTDDRNEAATGTAESPEISEITVFVGESDDTPDFDHPGVRSEDLEDFEESEGGPTPIGESLLRRFRGMAESLAEFGGRTAKYSERQAWLTGDLDSGESGESIEVEVSRRPLIVVLVLAVTMIGQLLHYNRDALAAAPGYGGIVRGIYGGLGSALYPEWKLSSFEVRGTEVVASTMSSATLNVLAKILIVGERSVGMPLIRVVLHDRWSDPVASGVFKPSEYFSEQDRPEQLMAPATMLPVKISVLDPGVEARGYIVDVCLPRRKIGLECQISRDPFR